MCDMCTVIGLAMSEAAAAENTTTTLRLAASQIATVDAATERGAGKSLLLRVVGPQADFGPLTAVEIVIDPDLIVPFLDHVRAEAHELFPQDVPAPDAATASTEQKDVPTPR